MKDKIMTFFEVNGVWLLNTKAVPFNFFFFTRATKSSAGGSFYYAVC
jgi:hypothetical protein